MKVRVTAPSALLIDSGELDVFARVLRRMGVDHERLAGGGFRAVAHRPRDLLITTWAKAQRLPDMEPEGQDAWEPVWICVHGQDFLPLRERMRQMGIHYLVHAHSDPESLRLLIGQILYQGAERRGGRRLPVGCEVALRCLGGRRTALLAELSDEGARLLARHPIAPGEPVTVCPPVELGLGSGVELSGKAIRCTPWEPEDREPAFAIVVGFEPLGAQRRERMERFLEGRQLGSPVTPLGAAPPPRPRPGAASDATSGERAPAALAEPDLLPSPEPLPAPEPLPEVRAPAPPGPEPGPEPEAGEGARERRAAPRGEYQRRVPTLFTADPDAPDVVFGYDLSRSGMRIARHPGLTVGSKLGLAIHSGSREEPLVVQAEIVRDDGASGLALQFVDVDRALAKRLDAVLESLTPLESLCEGDPEGRDLVLSRVVREP